MADTGYLYIDTEQQLRDFAQSLTGSGWLAVDTEFIRERTYYPQLCLLQVANEHHVACIDVLCLKDITPLLDWLTNPSVTKVFHSARQDLEVLYQQYGVIPAPVFDTQIAAALLCHSDQIGYGGAVQSLLGVELEKGHARTDWAARPLEAAQLKYAADDVRHLGPLYERERALLQQQGRLHWLDEDFAALTDPSLYQVQMSDLWRRVKEHSRLKGAQLATLQALAMWREQRAMTDDRPRKWVLRDDLLLELARRQPENMTQLERVRGVEGGLLRKFGADLLTVIADAQRRPRDQWPTLAPRTVLTPEQDGLVDCLMAVVRLRATAESLSPAMLGARRDLEKVVLGDLDVPVMHGWRGALVGQEIRSVLSGEGWLGTRDGKLVLERKTAH